MMWLDEALSLSTPFSLQTRIDFFLVMKSEVHDLYMETEKVGN